MAITETAIVYKDDAIKLANKIRVKMAGIMDLAKKTRSIMSFTKLQILTKQ